MALPINIIRTPVIVPSGATGLTDAGGIPLGAGVLIGIVMPATWSAADLTFQTSDDSAATWQELVNSTDGTAYAVKVAAGQRAWIDPKVFLGINNIRIRSGTLAVPVNQGADRALVLITRPTT